MNRLPLAFTDGVAHIQDTPIPEANNLPSNAREVLFRPEEIEIVEAHDAHFKGRVETAFFLGDRNRLVVSGVGADLLSIDVGPRVVIGVGDELPFRLRVDALMPSI